MFLDLNDSTGIAERLENKSYHLLLKEFFIDVTNLILECDGNILQYVGDEIIISWRFKEGTDQSNCIQCFFRIAEVIESKRAKYLREYGTVPSFKAGLHCGEVVAGEVGVIKRDITYSGDVLNTTSRILGMCKTFGVDLIATGELLGQMNLEGKYRSTDLGSINLRGKENEISPISIDPYAHS